MIEYLLLKLKKNGTNKPSERVALILHIFIKDPTAVTFSKIFFILFNIMYLILNSVDLMDHAFSEDNSISPKSILLVAQQCLNL